MVVMSFTLVKQIRQCLDKLNVLRGIAERLYLHSEYGIK